MHAPHRRPGLVAATCLTLMMTACSGETDARLPQESVSAIGGQRAQCTASDQEGELIVHPGSLTATEQTRLDDATMIEAVNLEIVERAVTAFGGNPTVSGIIRDYPPLKNAGLVDSLADWDLRRPLPGLLLEPEDGQQAILVALRLVDPTQSGHLNGITLASSVAGAASTQDYLQPVLVEPHEAICTVDELDSTLEWAPQ